MINHIVLFKLKDYPETEKAKICLVLKLMLEALKEKISEVVHLEVGINQLMQGKNFDLVLISHFRNEDDLNLYRIHPEHIKVVEKVATVTESRAAVDFEF